MTIPVSNVLTTDTFGAWLTKTNILATIATLNAVTVDSTTGGSLSTGNGYVNGFFGANYLVVNTGIVGGNISTNNAINILSNTLFQYNSANLFVVTANADYSNTIISTNTVLIQPSDGGNTIISGNNLNVNTALVNVTAGAVQLSTVSTFTGNTTIKANTSFNTLAVTGNSTVTRIVANTTNTTISGNVHLLNSLFVVANTFLNNLNVAGNANVANLTVTGTISLPSIAFGGTTSFANIVVSNTANIDILSANIATIGFLDIANSANVFGNFRVGGNLTVDGNLVYGGIATADFVPSGNLTFSLGNTTAYWSGLFTGALTAVNNATFGSNVSVTNRLSVTSNTVLANTLTVAGNVNIANTLTVTSPATFSNNVAVAGVATLTSNAVTGSTSTFQFNGTTHVYSGTFTFSSGATATVDAVDASLYRSIEYLIQMTDASSSSYHITKVLAVHDGTTPYVTEYATIFNNSSVGTVSVTINGGNVNLRVTPSSSTVVVRFVRTGIVV